MIQISKKIALLLCVFASTVYAQHDTLTPMYINYGIREHLSNSNKNNTTAKIASATIDTLTLPFYDDFSKPGPYPDSSKWRHSNTVFANYNFPKNPKTIGAATFDGLNQNGFPYNASQTLGSVISDSLISLPIHLDSSYVLPSDSVYLSFYYETLGFGGDPPEQSDILMLDLHDTAWPLTPSYTFARQSGSTKYDTVFRRVMIPISDPKYFSKNPKTSFQFRFRNKSTRCGSVDLWHIDNVYLGSNRSYTDTVSKDVAMVYAPHSLLNTYSAMPFKQYAGSFMNTTTQLTVRNNDTSQAGINITGYMNVYDNTKTLIYSQTNGSGDIFPYYNNGYCNITSISNPNYSPFSYNGGSPLTDSTSYWVKHFIKTSAFDVSKENDTVLFKQVFNNYFSYDDGTAEAGYQLRAVNSYNSELAVRYDMSAQDTLQAIDICFNPVTGYDCVNHVTTSPGAVLNLSFGLRVWNNNSGQPGSILYRDTLLFPVYTSNINYPFFRFKLKTPLLMGPTAGGPVPYYFGIKQDDCSPINFGFDVNNNSQSKIFYNLDDGSGWQNSSFKGSMMIRPIFGDSIRAIDAIHEQPTFVSKNYSSILLYPNPANDVCYFSVGAENRNKTFKIDFYNAIGTLLLSQDSQADQAISTSQLESGFYVVRISQNNKVVATRKIIITR